MEHPVHLWLYLFYFNHLKNEGVNGPPLQLNVAKNEIELKQFMTHSDKKSVEIIPLIFSLSEFHNFELATDGFTTLVH